MTKKPIFVSEEFSDTAGGASTSAVARGDREALFEDEEELATVTIIEEFDPSAILHDEPAPKAAPESTATEVLGPSSRKVQLLEEKKRKTAILKTSLNKKRKSGTASYGTKAERAAGRNKERKRRTEKAQLAGGKASKALKGKGAKGGKGKR